MFWFAFIMFIAQMVLGEVMRPKLQDAGKASLLDAPTSSEARPVPALWGTSILRSPNVLWYGDTFWQDISERVKTGIIGTRKVIVGYSYYLGLHLGLCHGKIDKLLQIRSSDKVLFNGSIVPGANGTRFNVATGQKIGRNFHTDKGILASENGLFSNLTLLGGGAAQLQNSYLKRFVGANIPGYRNISSIIIEGPSSDNVTLANAGTPTGNPTDPVPPASQATWDAAALLTRFLFYGLGGGGGYGYYSGYGWSGNIGTNNKIGQYAFVLQRIPTGLLAGTADAAKSTITSTATVNRDASEPARRNFATDPGYPVASAGNAGYFYSVLVGSPGSDIPEGGRRITVSYANLPPNQKYKVGDLLYSNGATWQHFTAGQGAWLATATTGYAEANPAEMIYEVMTDANFGINLPASFIDLPSFRAAAVTLWTEGFGLSGVWDHKTTARQLITEFLRYIDGMLFMDLTTGKFKLKLVRNDYDINTVPVVDDDTVIADGEFSRGAWDETTNEVKVVFTDNAANYVQRTTAVQDLANVDIQGAVVSTTIEYLFVTKASLANKLAGRDLRALTYPLAKISKLRVSRKKYALQPGDVFKYVNPAYGIGAIYMRVTGRTEGVLKSGMIELDCIQDIFSLGSSSYTDIDPGGWDDPAQQPKLIVNYDLKAAPYHFTQDGAHANIHSFAQRPGSASLNYNVFSHKDGATVSAPQRSTTSVGNGSMSLISVGASTVTETITVKCSSATVPATFAVVGSISGSIGSATAGVAFVNSKINFTVTAGSIPFAVNDSFSLGTLVTGYGSPSPVPAYTPTGTLKNAYAKNAGSSGPTDPAAIDSSYYNPALSTQFAIENAVDMGGLTAALADDIVSHNKNLFLVSDPVNGDEIMAAQWPLRCNGVTAIVPNWATTITDKGLLDLLSVNPDATGAETWTLTCTTGGGVGVGIFSVTGSVSGAKAAATVGTAYDNGQIAFTILAGVTAFIAGDSMALTCDPDLLGVYYFNQVWRGLLQTTPKDHGVGARVWLIGDGNGIIETSYGLTDGLKVKYGDVTSVRAMRLDEITPEQSIALTSQPLRPYPPGDTRVNALPWPVEITGFITASWAERNRKTQLAVVRQDDPTVPAELDGTGVTVLKFYRLTNEATSAPFLAGTGATWTLFKTYTGITQGILTYDMTLAEEIAAAGIGGNTRPSSRHRMELYSTRDGFTSEQSQIREYDCAGADMLADFYADS